MKMATFFMSVIGIKCLLMKAFLLFQKNPHV